MEEVESLRGRAQFAPDCTIAKVAADKLWKLVTEGDDAYVNALGCMTGTSQTRPVGKIADKAVYRSVFLFCPLGGERTAI